MLRRFTILCLSLLPMATLALSARAAEGLKIVVILDNSGSMNERMRGGKTRIAAAKQSLLQVLEQTPEDAEVGVLLLNEGPSGRWLVPLGPVDFEATRRAVTELRADGPTPLGESMQLATNSLLELRNRQRYGTYKLLIVTDGEATDGGLVDRYLPDIQARGVLMDVIGVSMGSRHSLATRANTYRNADDPESLEKAISDVVLGESSGTGAGDAGESDFELLAPLPAEVAAASLAALANPSNEPVGAANRDEPQGPFRPGVPQSAPSAPQPGDDGFSFSFASLIVVVVILWVVVRMMASIGKRR